jgi:hypothetical protein
MRKPGRSRRLLKETGVRGTMPAFALLACLVSDVIVNGVMYITGQFTMS